MSITPHSGHSFCSALLLVCALALSAFAQSSGGSFQITQSVVAGGGEKSTDSGNLIVEGAAGQSGAGTLLRIPPYSQTGGF